MGGISSYKISILCGYFLPASLKLKSSAFSTYLGNQLGVIFMVRGIQARQWVVVGCVFSVGVCGELVPGGEGSGVGMISTIRGQPVEQISNIPEKQEGTLEV